MANKKILFISHDATQTGAPILLLNLAKALQASNEITVKLLIKNGDLKLLEEFRKLGETFIAQRKTKVIGLTTKSAFRTKIIKESLKDVILVISNTITNGDILPVIRKYYSGPIISYIHELEMGAKAFTTPGDLELLKKHTDYFLVPSKAVATYLTSEQEIDENKIGFLPYYIPEAPKNYSAKTGTKFIVGGAGTIDWRKGPENFLLIAAQILKKRPTANIKFIWKGASEGIDLERIKYDIKRLGIDRMMSFELASNQMDAFYSSLDVFLLTSREDPYPLVILEAASFGVPSVCFTNAGGAQEFIQDDAGFAVSYLDIESAANAILDYYDNDSLRSQHSEIAKNRFKTLHADPIEIQHRFKEILSKVNQTTISSQP